MTISYWKGMGWFSHGRQTGVMRPVAAIRDETRSMGFAYVAPLAYSPCTTKDHGQLIGAKLELGGTKHASAIESAMAAFRLVFDLRPP